MFLENSPEDLGRIFEKNLLLTNRSFNYYVDWTNVTGYKDMSVEIYAIDSLISVPDVDFFDKFKTLLIKLPSTIQLFPFLIGLAKEERKNLILGKEKLTVIQDEIDEDDNLEYSFHLNGNSLTDEEINKYYHFFVQMGLKNLYQHIIEKSTLDYIVGVLVGLDSNGRKNRGGAAFELACLPVIESVCKEKKLGLLVQKKFKELRKYDFNISVDVENRKADFIVFDPQQKKAMNIEVNFYNDTGSKPEEIIDSYINRQQDLSQLGIKFSLVTDGNCWKDASNQLAKGFRHLRYLQNYYLLKHGMLAEIIQKEFCE